MTSIRLLAHTHAEKKGFRGSEIAGPMSLIQPPPVSHDASQLHPAFHRTKLAIYSRIDIRRL